MANPFVAVTVEIVTGAATPIESHTPKTPAALHKQSRRGFVEHIDCWEAYDPKHAQRTRGAAAHP